MISIMKARLVFKDRVYFPTGEFAEIVVWQVPEPVRASAHVFKYRLAFVASGVCVIRYDNEAGKGDHRHLGDEETPYLFRGVSALLDDFNRDVERWMHDNA